MLNTLSASHELQHALRMVQGPVRPEYAPGWYRRHERKRVRRSGPPKGLNYSPTGAVEILHIVKGREVWKVSHVYTHVLNARRLLRQMNGKIA